MHQSVLSMKPQPVIHHVMAWGLIIFIVLLAVSLKADDETSPSAEQMKVIQEKSLNLLRDIVPAGSSDRKLETMVIDGGLVYWGNIFDPKEVVALVNLAPEKPVDDDWPPTNSWGTWPCYLSLWVWEKDHWVFRQYLDNANSLVFHDRKDSPHHFVQASRKTGRYEGDYLSWYYDPLTKTLVRTDYETWGPFFLLGNYLCTTNGFERRTEYETVWVYSYKEGRKGDLVAIYSSNINTELPDFSITFRDNQTGKLWTYSFHQKEDNAPYTVDAVEGDPDAKVENPDPQIHHAAEIKLSGEADPFDCFFERLTGLSSVFREAADNEGADWQDTAPKTSPAKQVKYEITGDPEIIQHLKNP